MIKRIQNISGSSLTFGSETINDQDFLTVTTSNSIYTNLIEDFYENLYDGNIKCFDSNNTEMTQDEAAEDVDEKSELERQFNNYYRIYDFLVEDKYLSLEDPTVAPHGVEYSVDLRVNLAAKYSFDQYGFLRSVVYYAYNNSTIDPTTLIKQDNFEYEVLKVDIDYKVGIDHYVTERRVTRDWMLLDGTYGNKPKITVKQYNINQAQVEGEKRRKNIINKLKSAAGQAIYLAEIVKGNTPTVISAEEIGMPLLASLSGNIKAFEDGAGVQQLVDEINNKTIEDFPVLFDTTITSFDNEGNPASFDTVKNVINFTLLQSQVPAEGLDQYA